MQALVEKNKELLASSELTPEALETAKTGLETLIALLKEDKPAVFVDPATGVEVQFSNLEPTVVKGLKVAKVEANQAEKEELKGREGIVFDIEGVDASGQDIDTHHPSLVKIPVDKDKEVEQVLFFPEGSSSSILGLLRELEMWSSLQLLTLPTMRLSTSQQKRKDQINRSNQKNRLNLISLFNQINLSNQLPQ